MASVSTGDNTSIHSIPKDNPDLFALPSERAHFHYERAKTLFKKGTRCSVELERCLHELGLSTAFVPDEITYNMMLVDVLLECKDTSSAMHRLRHVLKLKPNHIKAKRKLFDILVISAKEMMKDSNRMADTERSHCLELAEGRIDQAQRLEKDLFDSMNPDLWTMKAVIQSSNKKFSQSIDSLDRAIHVRGHMDDDTLLAETYILKAKLLWAQGLSDAGTKQMLAAAKLAPFHPEVKEFSDRTYQRADREYRIAVEHFGRKEYSDALVMARSALATVGSNDVKLHILLSKIHRMKGELQAAYGCIENAKEVFSKNNEKTKYGLMDEEYVSDDNNSYESSQKSNKDEELNVDTKANDELDGLDKNKHIIHNKKSRSNRSASKHKMVDEAIKFAENLMPPEIIVQQHLVLNEMALTYAEDGQFEKAIALLTKILYEETSTPAGAHSIDYRYWTNRGDCYRAQGDLDRAIADYTEALELSSGNWDVRTRLGLSYYSGSITYFNDCAYDKAEKQLDDAIKYNYKVAEFYSARGRARYYQGKYDAAYDDYSKALELNPEDKEVQRRLQQFSTGAQKGLELGKSKKPVKDKHENTKLLVPNMKPLLKSGVGKDSRILLAPGAVARALIDVRDARGLPHIPSNQMEDALKKKGVADLKMIKDAVRYHKRDPTVLPRTIRSTGSIAIGLESTMGTLGAPDMKTTDGCAVLSTAYAIVDDKFKKLFHERQSARKSTMYTMIDNVRNVAKLVQKAPPKKEKNKNVAVTPQAMKKISDDITKKTLATNPLVAGVLPHKDDPALLALSASMKGPKGKKKGHMKTKEKST
jgi:tetratricopeptide (TPR) repeat protein